MKKSKKIISLLLSILMIITSVPLMAVESFAATNGTTGDCTWTLDGTVLTISGNGKMEKNYINKYPSWGLSITKVVIENGVTSISGMAFADCKSLTSVTIPDSVTSIGSHAFSYCTSLTSITIPDSITNINDGTFLCCRSLTSVNIPDSVKSIGDQAFLGCTSLTSINIPDGVTSIGNGVFEGCTNLKRIDVAEDNKNYCSIDGVLFNKDKTKLIKYPSSKKGQTYVIPDSVTSIGGGAFEGSAYYNNESNWDNGILYIGNHLIEAKENVSGNVEIRQGTKTIAERAFSGCTSLTSITIPDGVTSIGDQTFYKCRLLTSITIPDGVTSIGYRAFCNCRSLTSVTIPDSVTSIGMLAFANCTSLTSVTIPDSVTSIGSHAFSYCTSLTIVTIGNGVTDVGEYAFNGCASLTSVTIGNSVTSIGIYAFSGCTSLTSITIPDSVTYIGGSAFKDCTSLTSVTVPNSVTKIGDKAFGYYYDSIENKYKAVDGFTIYGYQGSAAEKYAKDNGFEFLPMASTNELLLISVTKMPTKTEYYVGDTLDTTGLEITAKYTDNTEKVITSDLTITGFDSSVAGKNTITVAYDGKTATFNVEVVKPRITIANNSLSFDSIGSTKSLTVTTTPIDQKIAWSSSNKNVATVSDGVVTAKGAGNATITATITVNGIEYSAECTVDVKLPTMSFPDVRSGNWYYDAVKYNFERGYITGYSNGTFGPANNIQRQDFALILARIAGADLSTYEGQNGGFSDVPTNTYYSAAVAWAKDRGIVTGYSADNFGVGTYITREQISLILCRYLGGEASGDVDAILNAYPDGGNTSAWAKVGVAWAVENGIVGNAGYINPTGNAGRAEVAQIIYNMSNKGMI